MAPDSCKNLRIDIVLTVATIVACGFGLLSLYSGWNYLSYIAIGSVDLYLLAVVLTAAIRADAKPRGEPSKKTYEYEWKADWLFPSRRNGIVAIPLMAAALIISFAGLYLSLPADSFCKEFEEAIDALYFSLVTLTTVGYGDFAPISPFAKMLVMFQIGSGFLILIAVFPLLISRVSDF